MSKNRAWHTTIFVELPEYMGKLQMEGLTSMELVIQKWKEELIDDAKDSWPRAKLGKEYINLGFEFHLSLFDSSLTKVSHFCTIRFFFSLLQIIAFREMIVKSSLSVQIFIWLTSLYPSDLWSNSTSSESPFLKNLSKRYPLSLSDSFYSFLVFF